MLPAFVTFILYVAPVLKIKYWKPFPDAPLYVVVGFINLFDGADLCPVVHLKTVPP